MSTLEKTSKDEAFLRPQDHSGHVPATRPKMSERELQANIIDACQTLGLLVYHTHDSRRSQPGFPDLVITGPGGILFAELKSQDGHLSRDQTRWRYALQAARAPWRLWRPADWYSGDILTELQTLARRA